RDPQLCRESGLRVVVHEIEVEQLGRRVVLLAGSLDERETIEATRLGVKGLLLKEMSPRLMLQCIRKVPDGGTWLEGRSTERAVATRLAREAAARDGARPADPARAGYLCLIACGLPTRQVAPGL